MKPPSCFFGRVTGGAVATLCLLASLCLGSASAAAKTGIAALDAAAAAVAALPSDPTRQTVAAHVSPEGHWTLVNRAGEPFTAATPEELKRGFDVLLPNDAASPAKSLHLYLTAESVFQRRTQITALPRDAVTWLAGLAPVRLMALGSGAGAKLLAEVRPNLLIEISDAATYAEVTGLLARPLDRSNFRLLSIEPGGPSTLAAKPKVDRASGRIVNDMINPVDLPKALPLLAGQTAVIIGRLDGDTLTIKPAAAPERTLRWDELTAVAAQADVNLLMLRSPGGQQPGARNWLWQKVEIKGLDNALTHATLGDFFDALGSPSNRLVVSAQRSADGRLMLDVHRAAGLPSTQSSTAQVGSVLSDLVSGLTGKVVHEGAIMQARSAARQTELDRRLISFVPAGPTWAYAALMLLGLAGLPVALGWWGRLWPQEAPTDYRNALGYWAARTIRIALFALIFLPLTAIVAGPVALFRRLGGRQGQPS